LIVIRRPHAHGFGLVELIVALALAGTLAVVAFTVFFNTQRATGSVTDIIENRQNSRTAVQLLERDLRMAGSGWQRLNAEGYYSGSGISVPAITPGYNGDATGSDTIGIMGAWDASTTLRAPMTQSTSTIQTVNSSALSVGDLVVVTNFGTAHMFQITANAGNDIDHSTTSPYNTGGTLQNWPSGGYKAGAKVYRVSWVSYSADTTSTGRINLVRWEAGQSRQVIASDIRQFKIVYLLQDETETRDLTDVSMLEQVRPVIIMRASSTKGAALMDSSWSNVKPRNY
jgi:prepilin-type N-terminal cleavage/methylation domain-containing protein